MVGGSVSGRPFNPDPTSYEETGIPCGNPARYQSRGVIRLNRNDTQPFQDQRLGIPGTGIESEADQHLKGLVRNQLETNITLESQLKRKKLFTSAAPYEPFCPDKTGALSLTDYQSLQSHTQYVQSLKECGFNEEEIQFKLKKEGLIPVAPKRRRYGVDRDAELSQLHDLQSRIKAREEALSAPDNYSNVRLVSRHALEVEQSLHKGTEKGKSLSHLVRSRTEVIPKNDPLLQTLMEEKQILSKSKRSSSTPVEDGKNQETQRKESSENTGTAVTCGCHGDLPTDLTSAVNLPDDIEPIKEKEIYENRLSLEQIKQLPKFSNYTPGEPSKVLFIKNLHHKATEADLVSLFIRFQQKTGPKIAFRLMKGKMKGQAFVTLPDVATATSALNFVNGFLFKSKPVIVQYGRQKKEPSNSTMSDYQEDETL